MSRTQPAPLQKLSQGGQLRTAPSPVKGFTVSQEIKVGECPSVTQGHNFINNEVVPGTSFLRVLKLRIPGVHIKKGLEGNTVGYERYVARSLRQVLLTASGNINLDASLCYRPYLVPKVGTAVDTMFAARGKWRQVPCSPASGSGKKVFKIDPSQYNFPVVKSESTSEAHMEVWIGEIFISSEKYNSASATAVPSTAIQTTLMVDADWDLLAQDSQELYEGSQVTLGPALAAPPAPPVARTTTPQFDKDTQVVAWNTSQLIVDTRQANPTPIEGIRYRVKPPIYVNSVLGSIVALTTAIRDKDHIHFRPAAVNGDPGLVTPDQAREFVVPGGTQLVYQSSSLKAEGFEFTIREAAAQVKGNQTKKAKKVEPKKLGKQE